MSGITPLIDTLLHQVLGRQAEVSTQRALNAPVQPVYAGDGPRALQGDAGLDGRPLAPLLGDLKRLPGSPDGFRQAPPGTLPGNAPSSTQTHFSPAARTIADVLLRFPAPPTVLRPQAPLMSTQEPPSAPVVANRLEASIRDSGLFYEAHLKRWFQGDTSRQQLMREPQMQPGPRPAAVFVPSFTSAVLSATATAPASALVTNTAPFTILPDEQSRAPPGAFRPAGKQRMGRVESWAKRDCARESSRAGASTARDDGNADAALGR